MSVTKFLITKINMNKKFQNSRSIFEIKQYFCTRGRPECFDYQFTYESRWNFWCFFLNFFFDNPPPKSFWKYMTKSFWKRSNSSPQFKLKLFLSRVKIGDYALVYIVRSCPKLIKLAVFKPSELRRWSTKSQVSYIYF